MPSIEFSILLHPYHTISPPPSSINIQYFQLHFTCEVTPFLFLLRPLKRSHPLTSVTMKMRKTWIFPWLQSQETTSSLRGANRFLAQKTRAVMTCNKYPRVCRAKGSPGPDCCKKKCVSVLTDRAQLWNVWKKVQVSGDLLQREVCEPDVRQEKLWGVQQQVQERECVCVWDV
ncbi:hypothetical protein OIU85_027160 [Salix viminalis]|uniref:Uncharacterized protein n=1 Tax=Salix viminalis TaxID=40686 RepID=A0A9Q0QHJ0_SALVM|nr:hypothetical protein OIU85_027160 [Salix viminalis]